MKQQSFLIEIGTEELPPKALKTLSLSFGEGIKQGLAKAELNIGEITLFATPRRLAVLATNVDAKQTDREIERRGPAVSAAFDKDHQPTKAALGFAQSCGVSIDEITRLKTDKGEWLYYLQQQKGQPLSALLPDIINQALKQLPIPKPMRWGAYDTEFIRPVQWVVLLLDDQVLDAEILGKQSGRVTHGHRFHQPDPITIPTPNAYENLLETEGLVIASFEKRKTAIHQGVIDLAQQHHAQTIIEEGLLDEVTGLVEWPTPLLVNFDREFLDVPQEALIAAMHDHQKCFPVVDDKQQLLPHFITVSNLQSSNPQEVIAGNERVMRARLADAAFFYNTDLKKSLEDHLPALKHVTFQAKLGSLYDKAVRLSTLSHFIASKIDTDPNAAERAGLLAKCDLLSDMVGEFPELQGIMGSYYAKHDNEPTNVATAIREQYLPRFSADKLPDSDVGCALALAERIDTLVGIFGIGEIPTGDKDPFALRRAALGVVKIITEKHFALDLNAIIEKALLAYGDSLSNKTVVQDVQQFILERLRAWYLDQQVPADAINAVLARQVSDLYDISKRISAVSEFRQLNASQALAAANKRVSKLLLKEGKDAASNGVQPSLFEFDAERDLAEQLKRKEAVVTPLFTQGEYTQALTELANLREPVDKFFDDVMVMVDDESIRNNRLALLASLRRLFLQVADISLLQSQKST